MGDQNQAAGAPGPVVPRRRRWLRVLATVVGVLGLIVVAIISAVPYAVSSDAARRELERELTAALGAPVAVASHDFSWFDGLRVEGISIDNPSGFPADHKAFVIRRLRGDTSILGALRGRFSLEGTVEGMALRLYEKADGTTNLGALFGRHAGSSGSPGSSGSRADPRVQLADLAVELRARDSLIEIVHEQRGVVESLREIDAGVRKPFGTSSVHVHFDAELHREGAAGGRIGFRADVDAADRARPVEVRFETMGLELARYRSLLNSFLPPERRPEAFEGRLDGAVTARVDLAGPVELDGELTLRNPRLRGALFGGMDLRGERWSVRPKLRGSFAPGAAVGSVSTEGLAVDTGFFALTGMASDAASTAAGGRAAIGVTYDVDLAALSRMGLAPLDGLQKGRGRARGTVTLPVAQLDPDRILEQWSTLLVSAGELEVDGFVRDGLEVAGLHARTGLESATATLESDRGTLNGGAMELKAQASIADLAVARADARVRVRGSAMRGDVVPWLRYVVPLLGGLPLRELGPLDLRGSLDADLQTSGPLLPADGESRLQWLERWRGSGAAALRGGAFRPAVVWQQLLDFAGVRAPVEFDAIDSKFSFASGKVSTEALDFSRQAAKWSLHGSVGLDGRIDYRADLRNLLRGHRDGEKILRVVGDAALEARITGTLDTPVLQAPSYARLAEAALKGAARQALEGLLEKKGAKKLEDLLRRR